jgi:hypothetical protein
MEFAPLWFALLIPLIAFAVASMFGLLLKCEQGRIRRTTLGGIFRPDRHAFLAKVALSLRSQPAIKFRPAPLPRGGTGCDSHPVRQLS